MTKHQIRLSQVPANRRRFIRALRLIGGMPLKQANDLAIHVGRFRNTVVVAGIDAGVAAHVSDVLRTAGAEVVVEPSSIDTPMLCAPAANEKYKWTAFKMIEAAF